MARTRSNEAHERVLRAAEELFSARGVEATSMDALAQASGVSKATIYNHWKDKEALLLELMLKLNGANRERETIDSGDVLADLTYVLTRRPPDEHAEARARLMPGLISYSATHPEFGEEWRRQVMAPARECLRGILEQAEQRGFLKPVDPMLAQALLLGPMLYSHIFQNGGAAQLEFFGPRVAETFWVAYRTTKGAWAEAAAKRRQKGFVAGGPDS